MSECEAVLCCSEAQYIDEMGNLICKECMDEEVDIFGAQYEEFESIVKENDSE